MQSKPKQPIDIIHEAAQAVAEHGTITPELMTAPNTFINKNIHIGADAIYQKYADYIKRAKSEIYLVTNVWETESEASRVIMAALDDLQDKLNNTDRKINVYIVENRIGFRASVYMKRTTSRLWAPVGVEDEKEQTEAETNWHDACCLPMCVAKSLPKFKNYKNINVYYATYKGAMRYCLHTKYFIADQIDSNDYISILNSANIQVYNHGKFGQHNIALTVKGPNFIRALLDDFKHIWVRADIGKTPTLKSKNPAIQAICNLNLADKIEDDNEEKLVAEDWFKTSALLVTHPSRETNICPQNTAILKMIETAEETICIQTPNLNNPEIINELAKAVNRNIETKIILSQEFGYMRELITGGPNTDAVARLRAKIDPEQEKYLILKWYRHKHGNIHDSNDDYPANHVKLMIVDNQRVFFGSANFDNGSYLFLRELNAVFNSKGLADRLSEDYNQWFDNAALIGLTQSHSECCRWLNFFWLCCCRRLICCGKPGRPDRRKVFPNSPHSRAHELIHQSIFQGPPTQAMLDAPKLDAGTQTNSRQPST